MQSIFCVRAALHVRVARIIPSERQPEFGPRSLVLVEIDGHEWLTTCFALFNNERSAERASCSEDFLRDVLGIESIPSSQLAAMRNKAAAMDLQDEESQRDYDQSRWVQIGVSEWKHPIHGTRKLNN